MEWQPVKPVTVAIVVTVAAVAAVYIVTRAARAAADLGPVGIGAAVGGAVVDTGAGVVLGIGDAVGLPRTDLDECRRAMAEGRTLDASMVCPLPIFIEYIVSSKPPNTGGATGSW